MSHKTWMKQLLPVIHEDTLLLAVVKPAGIDTGSYAGQPTQGVHELLQVDRGPRSTLIPINRLSRYESGILLFGKAEGFARAMKKAWRSGDISQEFVAVARGTMKDRKLVIDSVHGASRGRVRAGGKKVKSSPTSVRESRSATSVESMRAVGDRLQIRCRTSADNTHAIRAQLRAAGLQLLGDRTPGRYQREPRYAETCLHLGRLEFMHPDRSVKITLTAPIPSAFDTYLHKRMDWSRPIHAAMVRRLPVLAQAETNTYRLLSGHVEDLRGITIERFGPLVIMRTESDASVDEKSLRAVAGQYRDWLNIETVVWRKGPRKGKAADDTEWAEASGEKLLLGNAVPEELTVIENGLKFLVRPGAAGSSGLFLDQRDNRQRVRDLSRDKSVLNLFAYTCGFSVAAAAGGAARVVSVDLAPRNIEWGKTNFALNGLPIEPHLFLTAHVSQFLKRGAKDAEKYDVIVVDPPSFAHGRKSGQDFSVERDLTSLVASLAPMLQPGGRLLVSMNLRRMSWRALRERVRAGLSMRKIAAMEVLPLPPDFAMDPDHAKSLLITVS